MDRIDIMKVKIAFNSANDSMCIASSKFSTDQLRELRSRREPPLATLVDVA